MGEQQAVNNEVRTSDSPAGGTPPRERGRRFLAPGGGGNDRGYRGRPGRELELDVVADGTVFTEQPSAEQLEAVRAATRMIDEPECIGPTIVDAYGSDARFYRDQQHAAWVLVAREARVELSLEARIADVERRARRRKLNLTKGIVDARGSLERARRGGRRPSTSLVRLVEGLEAKLDGPVAAKQQAA